MNVAKIEPARRVFSGLVLCGLALGAIIFSLIVLEITVRIFHLDRPTKTSWRDRPTAYYLPADSKNMRDFRYSQQKPDGTFRIAVIGDSFTFGPWMQFDDTFTKRLERMLRLGAQSQAYRSASRSDVIGKISPPNVEVINFGVSGHSSAQEARYLERILPFHPDLILLQITLNDAEREPYREQRNRERNRKAEPGSFTKFSKRSALVRLLAARLEVWRSRKAYIQYHTELFKDPVTRATFDSGVQQIAKLGMQAKVPVAAVLFPMFSHPFDSTYPFQNIHDEVRKTVGAAQLPLLDLLTQYRGIPPARLQVLPGEDSHPNEIANRIAADAIYAWLISKGLIPEVLRIKRMADKRRG